MKINYFPIQKIGEKSGTVLQISLMSDLIEELILISASAFNLLQYVISVEAYEENCLHTGM